jgi:hypothetical protein
MIIAVTGTEMIVEVEARDVLPTGITFNTRSNMKVEVRGAIYKQVADIESFQSEATDSNVHELRATRNMHVTSPDDRPSGYDPCTHVPQHNRDEECEDRRPPSFS